MKLRVAKKVFDNSVVRDRHYRGSTLLQAARVIDHHDRKNAAAWADLMDGIGPEGRAFLLENSNPAAAFRILMESDNWSGDPKSMERFLAR